MIANTSLKFHRKRPLRKRIKGSPIIACDPPSELFTLLLSRTRHPEQKHFRLAGSYPLTPGESVIKKVHNQLNYKSLSEYVREAVNAKIWEDRGWLREMKRAAAMDSFSEAQAEELFESIEGDEFEDR